MSDYSPSLRGAFFATKQSLSVIEIASRSALAMTERLSSCGNEGNEISSVKK